MLIHLKRFRDYYILILNSIIGKIRFYRLILNSKQNKTELRRNKVLKDLYVNNEIIIFGNGISSNNFDKNLISNRFVFTVNFSMRSKNLSSFETDFHVWADMGSFVNDQSETIKAITKQVNNTNVAIFLPIETRDLIQNNGISSDKIHYFYSNKVLLENSSIKEDLTKNIHGHYTVVQWAIIISIYMGFKKIYLIGVESTNILSSINIQLGRYELVGHSYEYSTHDLDLMKSHLRLNSMVTISEGFFNILKSYKIINAQSKKIGVEIINLTKNTLIDSIKKVDQEDLNGDPVT